MSIAEELAKKQKKISIAEFFERNKHILGFDSKQKALIVSVKEAIDNSLDACEEANILPEIFVQIKKIDNEEYQMIVEDNGPGIVRRQIGNVFGRLLYGSRFHALKQTRGKQGIGISAVVLYSQITTGKPTKIITKTANNEVADVMELMIDIKKNTAKFTSKNVMIWDKESGTRVETNLRVKYIKGNQSVYEYLRETAIVNPHAQITFVDPDNKWIIYERATEQLPPAVVEIKPHPEGIELGELLNLAKSTEARKITSFLTNEFTRVSSRVAKQVCEIANIDPSKKPKQINLEDAKEMLKAFKKVNIMAPPTVCLSPIGEKLIKKGLKNILDKMKPSFYTIPTTRNPQVYSGNPFHVEIGIVYGGDLPKDQPIKILRFANRVPLLYQQGACAITKAIERVNWRQYGLEQRGGRGIPIGPAIVLVHIAATRVPFTSESKEAVAKIPKIMEEIELALKQNARQLNKFLSKKQKKTKVSEKFYLVQDILPEIVDKVSQIVKKEKLPLEPIISKIMNVVWIDDSEEYKKGYAEISIKIVNYTSTRSKFILYADSGIGKILETEEGKTIKNDQALKHTISLKSCESKIIKIKVEADKDSFVGMDYYVEGVNTSHVIGATALPGDWEIKSQAIKEVIE